MFTKSKNNKLNNYYKSKKPYQGKIEKGDIFFFDKGPTVGTEQHGGRPGVIVSNNTGNIHSENVLVVYTTTQPKADLPTHVTINSIGKESTVLCEQIHTLSTKKILKYYGHVTPEEMKAIDKALIVSTGVSKDAILEYAFSYEDTKTITNNNIEKELSDNEIEIERNVYKSILDDVINKLIERQ